MRLVEEEPAADVQNAEGANKATLLIPRVPKVILGEKPATNQSHLDECCRCL